MKEWKANQKLYHLMTQVHTDAVENFETIIDREDVVGPALEYLLDPREESVYPGKSYAVALIYSRLLWEHFNEPFYEVLNDPMLLYGTDEYFVPYTQDKESYDIILEALGGIENIPLKGRWVDFTVQYFKDECMAEAACFKI